MEDTKTNSYQTLKYWEKNQNNLTHKIDKELQMMLIGTENS